MFIVMVSLSNPALAGANDGEALFHIQCIGCHHFGNHAVGPDLCGLAGRKAGTATGYSYSRAMQDYSVIWNKDSLEDYLESPMTIVPGTKMGIIGFDDKHEREALANYVIERSRSGECQ